jgi:hypothetical protein
MWGSVSTAPPDHFIVLPPARHGNGWRASWTAVRIAETRCAPEQYVFHNQGELMSFAATWVTVYEVPPRRDGVAFSGGWIGAATGSRPDVSARGGRGTPVVRRPATEAGRPQGRSDQAKSNLKDAGEKVKDAFKK